MKTLTGKITSNKMDKTVAVVVNKLWTHPIYKKSIRRTKKYLAHTEDSLKIGQTVTIAESKPISKKKRWTVIKVEK